MHWRLHVRAEWVDKRRGKRELRDDVRPPLDEGSLHLLRESVDEQAVVVPLSLLRHLDALKLRLVEFSDHEVQVRRVRVGPAQAHNHELREIDVNLELDPEVLVEDRPLLQLVELLLDVERARREPLRVDLGHKLGTREEPFKDELVTQHTLSGIEVRAEARVDDSEEGSGVWRRLLRREDGGCVRWQR